MEQEELPVVRDGGHPHVGRPGGDDQPVPSDTRSGQVTRERHPGRLAASRVESTYFAHVLAVVRRQVQRYAPLGLCQTYLLLFILTVAYSCSH